MSAIATTQFSYRSEKELNVWSGYPNYAPIAGFEKPEEKAATFAYSKYGDMYAYSTRDSVVVHDASSMKQMCEIKQSNVSVLWFSPLGSFLVTWQRSSKLEDGSLSKNLNIWDVKTGEVVNSITQKSLSSQSVQWTADESFCARLDSGKVHFSKGNDFNTKLAKLEIPEEKISQFLLSSGKVPMVAAFVPEKKGNMAIIALYSIPSFDVPVVKKKVNNADSVTFHWNNLGTNLLALTHNEVDHTNTSYMGQYYLYHLATAGKLDEKVPLDKEGPVHDVAWSPNSEEFAVVYGSMPAKATLFDKRSKPIHDFGIKHRNFVSFDPHGNSICIAGFGNLNGTYDIWDRKSLTMLASERKAPNSSYWAWSPCGQYFMSATLTPRLRVDNGFQVCHRTGVPIFEEAIDDLYQIMWRPEPSTKYLSQLGVVAPKPIKLLPSKESAKPGGAAAPTGAYVPPHLRGKTQPRSSSSSPTGRGHPGGKKGQTYVNIAPKDRSKPAKNGAPLSEDEKQKKIRNLEKKLRQINDLRKKLQQGESLEEPQLKKLNGEADVMRELAALHAQ